MSRIKVEKFSEADIKSFMNSLNFKLDCGLQKLVTRDHARMKAIRDKNRVPDPARAGRPKKEIKKKEKKGGWFNGVFRKQGEING